MNQNKENNEGNIDSAFASILPRLQQLSGKWFVMGSYGLKLQGMDISCDDIDIVTSHADAEWLRGELQREFEEVFGDNSHGGRFHSTFVRFMVNGYRAEIQGDLEAKTDNQWINIHASARPIIVDFKGRQIPVLSLTESAKIYALFGREKDLQKAWLIERYLAEST